MTQTTRPNCNSARHDLSTTLNVNQPIRRDARMNQKVQCACLEVAA